MERNDDSWTATEAGSTVEAGARGTGKSKVKSRTLETHKDAAPEVISEFTPARLADRGSATRSAPFPSATHTLRASEMTGYGVG